MFSQLYMPKTLDQKKNIVSKLTESFFKSKATLFANFSNLTMEQTERLKDLLFSKGNSFTVAKNTLIKKTLDKADIKPPKLLGATSLIFVNSDPSEGFKDLYKFIKDENILKVKWGLLGQKILTAEESLEISKLPSRKDLLTKVVGGFNAPLLGFAQILGGAQKKFIRALYQINKLKN